MADSVGMAPLVDQRTSHAGLSEDAKRVLKLVVTPSGALPQLPLPEEVSEDYINCKSTRGLTFHILEAGYDAHRPLVLLLHGFPELAYSWRKIMPTLASADNYVVAVDQRGYGRTVGWDDRPYREVDLSQFSLEQYVRDVIALINALGYKSVRCIIGHGFSARVAALCALMVPDVFKACVLISEPFKLIPDNPLDTSSVYSTGQTPIAVTHAQSRVFDRPRINAVVEKSKQDEDDEMQTILAHLHPPRKLLKWYNTTQEAADHYRHPPQGMKAFLRGYFHLQSGSSPYNRPRPLHSRTAFELEKLPNYLVMPRDLTMPETVQVDMKDENPDATVDWLSEEMLDFYAQEWTRTGFQGALNSFRAETDAILSRDLVHFAGIKIKVPTTYIAGSRDWATFQDPSVLQQMPTTCDDFAGCKVVQDAGHWPHEEKSGLLAYQILEFMWRAEHKSPIGQARPGMSRPKAAPRAASEPLKRVASPSTARKLTTPPPPQRRDSKDRHERSASASKRLSGLTYDPDAKQTKQKSSSNGFGPHARSQSNGRSEASSSWKVVVEEPGPAPAQAENDERRRGPQSTASIAATQGSEYSTQSRSRWHVVSRSSSIDAPTRKPRADTPANNALMGKPNTKNVSREPTPMLPDSPIPELAPPDMLANPNPLSWDGEAGTRSRPPSAPPGRFSPPPRLTQANISNHHANHSHRESNGTGYSNGSAAAKRRPTPQSSPPRPDSATVAEENARIYKEVQLNAWRNLQEAEKTFHRMGITVTRKQSSQHDSASNRDFDASSQSQSWLNGSQSDKREKHPRRKDNDVEKRDIDEKRKIKQLQRAHSDEADQQRRERDKARMWEFDMRTHPGTAIAERDRFHDAPAGMRG